VAEAKERYELPVPGTPRGERTRTALLDAAEGVFGEVGYERASITAITQRAGVAQGTFYKWFPSKHAIFVELVIDFGARVRRHLAAALSDRQHDTRAAVERAGLEAYFRFALDHPGLYAVVREAEFVAPASYRDYYESFVSAYVERLDLPVRDAETLAWIVVGAGDMLGLRWVVWQHRMPPRRVLEQIEALFEHGIG
jgi:AcrR family transcriptional regulator